MRVWVLILALLVPPAAKADVTIRFIANEGVYITNGETAVLIDALAWNSYDGRYALPSDEARAAMIAGHPPYENVVALLFTHIHGDHFDPEGAAAFSNRDGPARFVYGSDQVYNAFVAAGGNPDRFSRHVIGEEECDFDGPPQCRTEYAFRFFTSHSTFPNPWSIEGRPLFHRNGVDHFTYAIHYPEISILHLGDTQPQIADFSVWDDTEFDVILYPYWFAQMPPGQAFLESRPEARAIAFHIPAIATPLTIRAGLGDREYFFQEGQEVVIETP